MLVHIAYQCEFILIKAHLWSKGGVWVVRRAEVGHLCDQVVQSIILSVGLLQDIALEVLVLLLELFNIGYGVAHEGLLEVIQGVVHPVVEGLRKKQKPAKSI